MKNLFNSKFELTEEEKQLEEVIVKLLSLDSTRKSLKVSASDTICVLKNLDKHFTVLVDNVGITIQNTTFSTRHRLRDKVSSKFKDLIVDAVNSETEAIISDMMQKEYNLLTNINKLI